MLYKYRKTALIEAEQFDGSDEMIKKYKIIDKSKLVPVYYRDVKWLLPTRRGLIDLWENDWIITCDNDDHIVMNEYTFERTYERCD